ncbi:MAG TPA: helix-turn-helix transcriptional regulator, partial [Acidimicrobiales bacterium]
MNGSTVGLADLTVDLAAGRVAERTVGRERPDRSGLLPRYRDQAMSSPPKTTIGHLVRHWRRQRGLTQEQLADDAGVSLKHLSFVENGRTRPSREMVLHLARHLDVPLRERNELLVTAGYAPEYGDTPWHDPGFDVVRSALHDVLGAHEPWPAIVVDRRWDLLAANDAASLLTEGVDPSLLAPPVNVLRLCLHPAGLARRIVNLADWHDHIIGNLRGRGPDLDALREELAGYRPRNGAPPATPACGGLAVPLHLRTPEGDLRFYATAATFTTAVDVTVSELLVETFLPADAATRERLEQRATRRRSLSSPSSPSSS